MFTNTAAIILAGGLSRRMGQEKALLPHPDHQHLTLAAHLAAVLTALCPAVYIVARDKEAASRLQLPGVQVLTDNIPDQGPLMGMYSGLLAIHAPRALVIAVDMPFVQPALLSYLLSQSLTPEPLVPLVATIPQVLLAIYPRVLLPRIEQLIQLGRHDPRAILTCAPIRYIEETALRHHDPTLRSFVNLNTPSDLANWTSHREHREHQQS